MERSQVACAALILALTGVLCVACVNPFAPALRGTADEPLYTDAQTVGKLLRNFEMAYQLADSFQYAQLLDEQFQFQYYDPQRQRTDGWYRETDLRATARLFRSFNNISLIWSGVPDSVAAISTHGNPVEVRVHYQLILDDLVPLLGFARFTLFRTENGPYRILLWQDEF